MAAASASARLADSHIVIVIADIVGMSVDLGFEPGIVRHQFRHLRDNRRGVRLRYRFAEIEIQIKRDVTFLVERGLQCRRPHPSQPNPCHQRHRPERDAQVCALDAGRGNAAIEGGISTKLSRHATRARGRPCRPRDGRDQGLAIPRRDGRRDRERQVHRDRSAIERQVRVVEQSHKFTLVPVAAGYRPPAWPRGERGRARRISIMAVGAATRARLLPWLAMEGGIQPA